MSRKLLITLVAVIFAASGYAKSKENDSAGQKFGVEAGYSHNWIYANTKVSASFGGIPLDDEEKATLNLDGFHIGPSYTYFFNFVDGLYLNGSVIYQYGRAANINKAIIPAITFDLLWDLDYAEKPEVLRNFHNCDKFSYTAHSLDVPIRIGYNYTFKSGLGFQVFLGPTFNFALDWKLTGTKDGIVFDLNQINGKLYIKDRENSHTYSDNAKERAVYNVFDISLGGGVGFTYKWFYFNCSCDWGLTNICKTASLAGKLDASGGMFAYTNNARQTKLKLSVGVRF